MLEPFSDSVGKRHEIWLREKDQEAIGGTAAESDLAEASSKVGPAGARAFTTDQLPGLNLLRDPIATSLSIETDDFDCAPFSQRGGLGKAHQLFGEQLPKRREHGAPPWPPEAHTPNLM